MIINVGSKWQFFNNNHDKSYINSHDTRQTIVLKEPRESSEFRLENNSGKEIVVYKIDGGVIDNTNVLKCDFGIFTEDNILYFIELKGTDYIHALEQMLSTIDILIVSLQTSVGQLNARIVLSKMRVPDINVTKEKILQNY